MLGKTSVETLVLERADAIAPSWRARYDGFRLNTSRWFLPPGPFAPDVNRWPTRDELVTYYEQYTQESRIQVKLDTTVRSIDRAPNEWRSIPPREKSMPAPSYRDGQVQQADDPSWPGQQTFDGEITHSSLYRNAQPYRDKSVLVVGPGASGFEIATQIATGGGSEVWLSIRTPPHIVHRDIGPLPSDLFALLGRRLPVGLVDWVGECVRRATIGDPTRHGLRPPGRHLHPRPNTGMIPTVDGPYVDAIKQRLVKVVSAVESLDRRSVRLTDGALIEPDAVIAATGYERNLEPLVGHLGVLTQDGHPGRPREPAHTRPRPASTSPALPSLSAGTCANCASTRARSPGRSATAADESSQARNVAVPRRCGNGGSAPPG